MQMRLCVCRESSYPTRSQEVPWARAMQSRSWSWWCSSRQAFFSAQCYSLLIISSSFTFSPTVPTSHSIPSPMTMHPMPYQSLVLKTFWCLTSNSILVSSPKALVSIFFTSFLNSLLEPGTFVSFTQQVITTLSGLPSQTSLMGWMAQHFPTWMATYPLPTGKQPGLTSRMSSLMPILERSGMRPNLMLSRGGDLLTSVPPCILICSVYCSPFTTGTKHCIMSVQLAAVAANISLGCRNLGQKQISVSPTLGTFSTKALKMERSWLLMPGLGLFLRMATMRNYLLRRRLSASELRIICPPPSWRLPSISIISSIAILYANKRISLFVGLCLVNTVLTCPPVG